MKKIGVVVPDLGGGGGVPTVAKFIVDAAAASGRFSTQLVSLAMGRNDFCSVQLLNPRTWRGPTAQRREWETNSYDQVGCWFSEFEFQRYRSRKILRTLLAECDLVQVVTGTPAAALAVADVGKPIALQVATRAVVERRRAIAEKGVRARWHRAMTAITNVLDDQGLQAASAVLVENQWMLNYAQRVCKDKGTTIKLAPPGVDTEVLAPHEHRVAADRADRYILSVGRFGDPRKNIGLLLEAYALVVQQVRHAPRLVLAGATSPPQKFFAKVEQLQLGERVHVLTNVPSEELKALYRSAHCFAMSSDEEGFGMALVEAMSCGVPVVSTRSGGPDGIVSDGVDGFLVPLDDRHAFAAALSKLCTSDDTNTVMGQNARAKVLGKYSRSQTAIAYLSTYDNLLNSSEMRKEPLAAAQLGFSA